MQQQKPKREVLELIEAFELLDEEDQAFILGLTRRRAKRAASKKPALRLVNGGKDAPPLGLWSLTR